MILPDPADDRDGEPRGVEGRGAAGDRPRRAGATAGRGWSVVAGVCLVAAAALWLLVGVEAAFVVATLGVVAWFWDQRNRIERRGIENGWLPGADDEGGEDFADKVEDEIGDGDERPKDVER